MHFPAQTILKIASYVVLASAIPAFCICAVVLVGVVGGGTLFGFVGLPQVLALVAALALPTLCVWGPYIARENHLSTKAKWAWLLSPLVSTMILVLAAR